MWDSLKQLDFRLKMPAERCAILPRNCPKLSSQRSPTPCQLTCMIRNRFVALSIYPSPIAFCWPQMCRYFSVLRTEVKHIGYQLYYLLSIKTVQWMDIEWTEITRSMWWMADKSALRQWRLGISNSARITRPNTTKWSHIHMIEIEAINATRAQRTGASRQTPENSWLRMLHCLLITTKTLCHFPLAYIWCKDLDIANPTKSCSLSMPRRAMLI